MGFNSGFKGLTSVLRGYERSKSRAGNPASRQQQFTSRTAIFWLRSEKWVISNRRLWATYWFHL